MLLRKKLNHKIGVEPIPGEDHEAVLVEGHEKRNQGKAKLIWIEIRKFMSKLLRNGRRKRND